MTSPQLIYEIVLYILRANTECLTKLVINMKFAQISDLHLVPHGELLHGLDPVQRLKSCLADIKQQEDTLQLCIITGDLTDRGDRDSYVILDELLETLNIPCYLILGNHDRRQAFLDIFPEITTDTNGFVQYSMETPEGLFLFLDTLDEGKSSGLYCPRRCQWLSQQLLNAHDQPVYLFMHHPPFDIGIPSLDCMKLDQTNGFVETIEGYSNIKHLFFGHVHRPLSGSWQNIPFSALPGTNHQIATNFTSKSPMPYSHGPAAYGLIHLESDRHLIHLHNYLDDYPRRRSDLSWGE
jgi:Icc protein